MLLETLFVIIYMYQPVGGFTSQLICAMDILKDNETPMEGYNISLHKD